MAETRLQKHWRKTYESICVLATDAVDHPSAGRESFTLLLSLDMHLAQQLSKVKAAMEVAKRYPLPPGVANGPGLRNGDDHGQR